MQSFSRFQLCSLTIIVGPSIASLGVVQHVSASTVNFTSMQEHETSPARRVNNQQKKVAASFVTKVQVPILKQIEQNTTKRCDLTKRYWVFYESYALYARDSCPFHSQSFFFVNVKK